MQGTQQNVIFSRQKLSVLGKLTAAALLGEALAYFLLLLAIGTFVLPLLIAGLALLIVAGIVVTGIRWAPLLGAMTGLGTMIGGIFSQQYFVYNLTHPAEGGPFITALLICVFAIISICTGISATVQITIIQPDMCRAGFLFLSQPWEALCWVSCWSCFWCRPLLPQEAQPP